MSAPKTSANLPLQDQLTPDAANLLRSIQASGFPGWSALGLEAGRAAVLEMKAFGGLPEHVARVEDIQIVRPDQSALSARLYVPASTASCPAMVYMHGGGFVLGTYNGVDSLCRSLALRAGCAVLSIDYRLAPEHKYPAALEDVQHALQWLALNAAERGLDVSRLAVGGDSSGATLAAAASLQCRDRGGAIPAFQLLVSPSLDCNYSTESYRRFGDGASSALSREDVIWFHNHYVNRPEELEHPYVSPLRAESFTGLPRTLLILGGIDPLFDECIEYASRLKQADVPVDVQVYPGMFHGFWRMGGVLPDSRQAIEYAAGKMQEIFSPSQS